MSGTLPLEQFDVDGAIQETGDRLDGHTRAAFFRRAGAASATLMGAGALMAGLPSLASAQAAPASDIAILNFALSLEYLEADFYRQAAASQALSGNVQRMAVLLADHETTHVSTLQGALGSAAIPMPQFDFKGTTSDPGAFLKTAFTLENTGVSAYLGQAGNIKTPEYLTVAATIVTVEARHAAAIAMLVQIDDPMGKGGISPGGAFDIPSSAEQIKAIERSTGFVVGGVS